jgi:hypothetical protein
MDGACLLGATYPEWSRSGPAHSWPQTPTSRSRPPACVPPHPVALSDPTDAGSKRSAAAAELGDDGGVAAKAARVADSDSSAAAAVRAAAGDGSAAAAPPEDSEDARKAALKKQLETYERDKAALASGAWRAAWWPRRQWARDRVWLTRQAHV